jgi:hypothetical protein
VASSNAFNHEGNIRTPCIVLLDTNSSSPGGMISLTHTWHIHHQFHTH